MVVLAAGERGLAATGRGSPKDMAWPPPDAGRRRTRLGAGRGSGWRWEESRLVWGEMIMVKHFWAGSCVVRFHI